MNYGTLPEDKKIFCTEAGYILTIGEYSHGLMTLDPDQMSDKGRALKYRLSKMRKAIRSEIQMRDLVFLQSVQVVRKEQYDEALRLKREWAAGRGSK